MNPRALPFSRGYSLVEVLASISVIAVIAATAIPNVSRINESSKDAVHKRNAQNFASVSLSAQAAGLDFVSSDNVSDVMDNIVQGDQVDKGSFDGAYFGIPGISEAERAEAAKFLKIENGMLVYSVAGEEGFSISDPPVATTSPVSPVTSGRPNILPDITAPISRSYSDPIPVSLPATTTMPAIVLETSISMQFYQTVDDDGNTWNHQITSTYVGDELTDTSTVIEMAQ